jgi:membrane protease YdiL (CAAX protease family)
MKNISLGCLVASLLFIIIHIIGISMGSDKSFYCATIAAIGGFLFGVAVGKFK